MDCEKFETTLIDELYGELDELTGTASKRHVSGCARCSALLHGLNATKRVATLPVVAPSEGFEERILAATQAARDAMKPEFGLAQIISWAGRWAMRPQTAMAAVFVLMLGTSGVLLSRRGPKEPAAAPASFTVTENGAPDTPAAKNAAALPTLDPSMAAAAHGVAKPMVQNAAPVAGAAPMASAASPAPCTTMEPSDRGEADLDESKRASAPMARMAPKGAADLGSIGQAQSGQGRFSTPPVAISKTPAGEREDAPRWATPPPVAPKKDDGPFATGQSQYAARDYGGAQQTFDGLAQQGDAPAALWAARSVRDGAGGCSGAAARFDQVAGQSWGSTTGYDATLEGGECYRALGQVDAARARFARLLTVPGYASRAQADIDAISQVASKSRRASAKPAAMSPAVAPAAPPATQQQAGPQQQQAAPQVPAELKK